MCTLCLFITHQHIFFVTFRLYQCSYFWERTQGTPHNYFFTLSIVLPQKCLYNHLLFLLIFHPFTYKTLMFLMIVLLISLDIFLPTMSYKSCIVIILCLLKLITPTIPINTICSHKPIFFSKPPTRLFLGHRAEDTGRLGG